MYWGDTYAEKAMMRMSGKIKEIYAEAAQDIDKKIQAHNQRFLKKDAEYRQKVADGKMTKAEYDSWKQGQVFTGKRWQSVRDDIEHQINAANHTATDIVNGERQAVFVQNVNYAQYTIDKDFQFGLSFNLYDSATVTRLIRDDPDMLPAVGQDEHKTDEWTRKLVSSAITQGVIQGESIPKISKRIAEKLGSSNEKSMIRIARTAMTSAQNAGRIEAMHNAQDMGIEVKKLWISTLDKRTRDAHRNLDGQVQNVDDPFTSDLGYIMFPGDPNAAPANVWRCRCTLGWEYPEYQRTNAVRAGRTYDEDGNPTGWEDVHEMTYRQWEQWKQKEQQKTDTDEPKNLSDVLSTLYDNHRTQNNLKTVSASDLKTAAEKFGTQSMFEPNLGKMDDKGKEILTDIISRYGEQYDTALSSVKIMDKQAALSTAFASVSYNYETNTATLFINPVKCNNTEKLVDRLRTLKEKGYISKDIPESKLQEYVYTHEFAHTLINIAQPLQKNRNFAKSDYDAIAQTRSKIEAVYKEYCSSVGNVEKRFKDAEFSYIMGASNGDEARKLSEQLKEVKISDYSLTNADEFMAECFACTKLYDTKNEYAERCMQIIEERYGRE